MSSPFIPTAANTPVAPTSNARYFYRRPVYSRNPITGESGWKGGSTANFNFEASGGHAFVGAESRIVMKLKVTAADGSKLSKTVRFATDPVANAFSAGMLSINGTTVTSTASNRNLKDILSFSFGQRVPKPVNRLAVRRGSWGSRKR